MANSKEPFIPQSDRPDVKISPDKSVSELTVRDLQSILGSNLIFKSHKDLEKYGYKEILKELMKDIKEYEYEKYTFELQSRPANLGDPGIAGLVEHIGGLHKKIDGLADQIAELKKTK